MMERFLTTLAVVAPLVGLLIGAGVGVRRRRVMPNLVRGYLMGCLGLLAYLLWCVPQWNRHYETKQRIPAEWKKNWDRDMRELIDPDAAERAARVLPPVVVAVGLLGGWLLGAVRKRKEHLTQGALLAGVGTLSYLLWCAYNWHVRWDPATGYVGLHYVRVLLLNLLMFVAAGLAVGCIWGMVLPLKETGETTGNDLPTNAQANERIKRR